MSAGAFLAANLANGITTAQMCRAIVKHGAGRAPVHPADLLHPGGRRAAAPRRLMAPPLLAEALCECLRHPGDLTLAESLLRLSRALPVGLFDNEPIREYLAKIYSIKGRTDDFRQLATRLIVVATELDSGQPVRFGAPGSTTCRFRPRCRRARRCPGSIRRSRSTAVTTSTACCSRPCTPRWRSKPAPSSCSASIPSSRSTRCAARTGGESRRLRRTRPADGALADLPHADPLAPDSRAGRLRASATATPTWCCSSRGRDDYRMFFTNIFSFSARKAVCEHAYLATRRDLLRALRRARPDLRPARHPAAPRRVDGREARSLVGCRSRGRRAARSVRGAVPASEALDRALDALSAWVAEQEAADDRPAQPAPAAPLAPDRTS